MLKKYHEKSRAGPEGSRKLRLPDFLTTVHSMVVGCQYYAPAAFTLRNIRGTHFHYGLSRPQGYGLVGRKYVTEKSSDTAGNRSRDRPTSSAAP